MLAEKIKQYRMENGLTQNEVAKAINSSQNTISNYENGIRTPTVKKLLAISKLLGCSVAELTEGDSEQGSILSSRGPEGGETPVPRPAP